MFSLRLSSSAAVGPTPSFVGCASSLAEGRPVSALEPAVEAMERPVAALEPAVEAMERPVAAMERPVGMQPCLPLHCHRPQHCDQVVNG